MTGWCPQFESGAVLVPLKGEPMILGGPESEPYAKLDSAIKETRNFPVFMVPDEEYPNATIIDFPKLFSELNRYTKVTRIGIVGTERMPVSMYRQLEEGFRGVEIVDISQKFVELRYIKTKWEIEQIRKGFELAYSAYEAMKRKIEPGIFEYEIAAAGEFVVRNPGANGYGFKTIVAGGPRSNAVVPMPSDRQLQAGEMVMIGISPKWKGYSGVMGHTLPVSGEYTKRQKEFMKYLKEAYFLTKEQLVPGKTGVEIDVPARKLFKNADLLKYLVCPFAHTIGIHEAESPFFGPNGRDAIKPGMTICIDVSFFGHPEMNGMRIESGYEITENGPVPLSPEMERIFISEL